MAGMLNDGVAYMVGALIAANPTVVSYRRSGVVLGTLSMSKQPQPTQYLDDGNGKVYEITPIDWIAKTSQLPSEPQRGDVLVVGTEWFEVLPAMGERVFRRLSPQMTRIHTKQVAAR